MDRRCARPAIQYATDVRCAPIAHISAKLLFRTGSARRRSRTDNRNLGANDRREQGWVMSYNATTLQQEGAFAVEPGLYYASVWQHGAGLSGDATGNVYLEQATALILWAPRSQRAA